MIKLLIHVSLVVLLFFLAGCSTDKVTDRDGNIYETVKIDNQMWMVENLNVSTFKNGDKIPEAKTDEEWIIAGKEGKAVWCYYNFSLEKGKKFGKLYNWYAVNDSRDISPEGWHIKLPPKESTNI